MKMMESFFRGIIRFRWLVIALVLGCTGLAGSSYSRCALRAMPTPLFPKTIRS